MIRGGAGGVRPCSRKGGDGGAATVIQRQVHQHDLTLDALGAPGVDTGNDQVVAGFVGNRDLSVAVDGLQGSLFIRAAGITGAEEVPCELNVAAFDGDRFQFEVPFLCIVANWDSVGMAVVDHRHREITRGGSRSRVERRLKRCDLGIQRAGEINRPIGPPALDGTVDVQVCGIDEDIPASGDRAARIASGFTGLQVRARVVGQDIAGLALQVIPDGFPLRSGIATAVEEAQGGQAEVGAGADIHRFRVDVAVDHDASFLVGQRQGALGHREGPVHLDARGGRVGKGRLTGGEGAEVIQHLNEGFGGILGRGDVGDQGIACLIDRADIG